MARILVVGGGAREHALASAIASAPAAHEVTIAPAGGAGVASSLRTAPVAASDIPGIVELALSIPADLVVVGPELPLTLGLVDALADRGIRAFGPSRAAAQLEGSKAFMKRLCAKAGVPTAAFEIFDDAEKAKAYVRAAGRPLVVKADGLCAGKGVVVAADEAEALGAIDRMMVERALGDAGRVVVIEETLHGDEASFHVICDGERAVPLVAAQDHKRIFDGDRGPNTGGMGAYAPAPVVTDAVRDTVMKDIVAPTLAAMRDAGMPFRGVLFVGLMIEAGVPSVLEFNVRFGDPETSVLVPMLDGDWFELLDAAARGDLSPVRVGVRPGAALAVVMASEGYPGTPRTGDVIEGLDAARELEGEGAFVFHAGTKRRDDGAIVTDGGRVLAVGARAASLAEARDLAYRAVARVRWRGEQHRSDIGHRALGVAIAPKT